MSKSRKPPPERPAPQSARPAVRLLAETLEAFFLARLARGNRICVALSGGRDSVVLLHALAAWRDAPGAPALQLSAVHVHHGLSAHADDWAEFCTRICCVLRVPLDVVRVTVPRDSGEGLEGAARRLRHGVFAHCRADWMALAHHRDDQAETVLLNLLRGAGLGGAAGMLGERAQACGPALVRPLLDVPRMQIEACAAEFGLAWVEDESNGDVHFRRNFLRHEVFPSLENKFPGAAASLARAAAHFAEGAALLDELAALDHAALATPAGRLALARFNALSPARARNVLRFAWTSAGFRAPDTRWVDEALAQLATADSLSETCLRTADGELHVYRGEMYVVSPSAGVTGEVVSWHGELEPVTLPWAGGRVRFLPVVGDGLRRSLLVEGDTQLRPRQGGEKLRLSVKRPRRSLRNLLQEAGVPPWERAALPFLWSAGRLAWVGGLGVDTAFACPPGDAGILPVWEPCAGTATVTRQPAIGATGPG